MFNKLKCLFSFNWFYIILFIILSLFNFWDEISVGRETLKIIIEERKDFEQKGKFANSKNTKVDFMDVDKISYGDDMIVYTGEVEYVCFHPLILNNKINSKDKNYIKLYNSFITTDEFENCLNKLYENNYILVDIFDIYKQVYKDGKFKIQRKDLKLPKGKRPFVLFVDDLSYGKQMVEFTSSKLFYDKKEDKIKSVVYENGISNIYDNKEVITILNNFVEKNPNFSLNDARGIISLTGSEGIFGYNTGKNAKKNEKNYETLRRLSRDIFEAKKVADKLKKDGWRFACHTYDDINFKNVTLDFVKNDMENWFRYVSNIVGSTNIFVYPCGNSLSENDERFKYLNENGFSMFCLVGNEINKDSFVVKDYVDIYRKIISYETINNKKKDFYKIFDGVINQKQRKSKLKFKFVEGCKYEKDCRV